MMKMTMMKGMQNTMRTTIGIMITAAAMACAYPMCSYGKPSITTNTSSDGSSDLGEQVREYQEKMEAQSGAAVTGTSGVQLGGGTAQAAVITTTDTGITVQTRLAQGEAAQAGLPQTVKDTINAINSGNIPLNQAIKDVDLTGYNALVQTNALIVEDPATKNAVTGKITQSLYIPNLVEGLGTVQVLFYDNVTGKWMLINPLSIDYTGKKISVEVTGSGTFSVVYKR